MPNRSPVFFCDHSWKMKLGTLTSQSFVLGDVVSMMPSSGGPLMSRFFVGCCCCCRCCCCFDDVAVGVAVVVVEEEEADRACDADRFMVVVLAFSLLFFVFDFFFRVLADLLTVHQAESEYFEGNK